MDWIQEPIDGGPQDPYANCPCYGAKCLGRCNPFLQSERKCMI